VSTAPSHCEDSLIVDGYTENKTFECTSPFLESFYNTQNIKGVARCSVKNKECTLDVGNYNVTDTNDYQVITSVKDPWPLHCRGIDCDFTNGEIACASTECEEGNFDLLGTSIRAVCDDKTGICTLHAITLAIEFFCYSGDCASPLLLYDLFENDLDEGLTLEGAVSITVCASIVGLITCLYVFKKRDALTSPSGEKIEEGTITFYLKNACSRMCRRSDHEPLGSEESPPPSQTPNLDLPALKDIEEGREVEMKGIGSGDREEEDWNNKEEESYTEEKDEEETERTQTFENPTIDRPKHTFSFKRINVTTEGTGINLVKNVSGSADSGGIFAILGPSGSGFLIF